MAKQKFKFRLLISFGLLFLLGQTSLLGQAGPDQYVVCNNTTMAATVAGGNWTQEEGPVATIVTAGSQNSAITGITGDVRLRWSYVDGLGNPTWDDVWIFFEQATINTLPQTICQSTFNGLEAVPARDASISQEWSSGSINVIFDDVNNEIVNVSDIQQGVTEFRWTLSDGTCSTTATVEITNMLPPTVYAGADRDICSETVTLNATDIAPATGAWSTLTGSGSFSNITDNHAVVSNIVTPDNLYRWTVTSPGCTGLYDDVTITSGTVVVDAGSDQANICDSQTLLTATGGTSGVWTQPGGQTSIFDTPSNHVTQVSNLPAGVSTYYWSVDNNGCVSTDEVQVTRNTYAADAGVDQTICGNSTGISASDPGPGGSGTWSIASGGGTATIANPNQRATTVDNISSFPVTLRWTLTGGSCSGSFDDLIISDQGTTVAQITGAPAIDVACNALTHNNLTGNTPIAGETALWYQIPGSTVTITNPNSDVTNITGMAINTTYTFVYQIDDGVCTTSDTVDLSTYELDAAWLAANPNFAGTDIVAGCTEYVTLNAADPLPAGHTGYWTDADEAFFIDPTDPNTDVRTSSSSEATSHTLTWTVSHGSCSQSDDVIVDNNYNAYIGVQSASFSFTPGDKEFYICGSGTAILEASPIVPSVHAGYAIVDYAGDPAAFTFAPPHANVTCTGNAVEAKAANPTLTMNGVTGDFTVIYTDCRDAGCVKEDRMFFHIRLDLNNGPAVFAAGGDEYYSAGGAKLAFAGADQNVCQTYTNLDAVDPSSDGLDNTSGYWTLVSGTGAFADMNSPTTLVTGMSMGDNVFRWTVMNDCSETYQDITVTMNGISGIGAGEDQDICEDYSVMDAELPVGGSGSWSVYQGSGTFLHSNSCNTPVTDLGYGSNVFLWSVVSPWCNAVDTVVVYSGHLDQPNGGPDQTVCDNGALQGVAPAVGTGLWGLLSGSAVTIDNPASPTSTFTMSGAASTLTYSVEAMTPAGQTCRNRDTVQLFNNTPTPAFAGTDPVTPPAICGNYQLGGNVPDYASGETGLWTTAASGATFDDASYNNTWARTMDIGDNNLVWTISKGLCSSSDTVVVNSQGVDATISFPITGSSTCQQNINIFASNPSPGTGLWTSAEGATFGNNTLENTSANLVPGLNTLTWTVTYGGCAPSQTVQINNTTITDPDAEASTPYGTSCDGTMDLTANTPNAGAGESGYWTAPFNPAIIFDNSTNPITTVRNLQDTPNNTLVWSISDGVCSKSDTVFVAASTYIITAGFPQTICPDNIDLLGSDPAPGTGVWTRVSGSGDIQSPSTMLTHVTDLTQGPSVFRWTVTQGACVYQDDVTITMNGPSTPNPGLDRTVCEDNILLDADAPTYGTGVWSIVGASTAIIDDPLNNLSLVTGLPGGQTTFQWKVTYGSCADSATVSIYNSMFPPNPVANAVTTCNADSFQLQGPIPPPGVTGSWTVLAGLGTFTEPSNHITYVSSYSRGRNIYRWRMTNSGCADTTDIVVENLSVTADAGVMQEVCSDVVTLDGNDPAGEDVATPPTPARGFWTVTPVSPPITFAPDNSTYNAVASGLGPDLNTFTWTITNGICSDSDEVQIYNNMPTVPNAGLDTTFCGINFAPQGYKDTIQLNANNTALRPGETAFWTQIAGNSTFVDNSTNPNLRVADLELYAQLAGPEYWNLNPTVNTYRWNIQYKNCIIWDEVTITNAAPDSAHAGVDQIVCWYDVSLDATDLGNYAQEHWWEATPPAGISFYDPLTGDDVSGTTDMPFNSYSDSLQIGHTNYRWNKRNTINTVVCHIWDETDVERVSSNLGATTAGSNQIVCSREAYMQGSKPGEAFVSPPPYVVTGEWSVISGGGNFDVVDSYSTLVTDLAYQTNIMRWTLTNHTLGCDITNDVYITNALPSNANAGPDQDVCENTALLSAERPTRGTGEWSVIGGGGTISNTTCQAFNCNVYVTNMTEGAVNSFLWTVTNSYTDPATGAYKECVLTDDIFVWNNAVRADAGEPITSCNDTAILAATKPNYLQGQTGHWTVTGGSGIVDDASAFNSMVTNLSPDGNTLRWTISNADCSDVDLVEITNNNPTDPVASTPTPNTCDGTATINGNEPLNGTGLWSMPLEGGGVIADPSSFATTVSGMPNGPTRFRWTIAKEGCSEFADIFVNNRAVVADAGSDIDNICGVEPAISEFLTLNAVAPNLSLGQTGNWNIVASTGTIQTPSLFNTEVTGMDDGENTFRWTISNGICSATDEVSVFVYIPTTANAGGDYETCADIGDSRPLTGNTPDPGRGTGTWSLTPTGGGNITDPTSAVTSVSNLGPDLNTFEWTIDHNGCTSTSQVTITNNFVTADAGPDEDICYDSTTLAANDPNTFNAGLEKPNGFWTRISGTATFDDQTLYNTAVSGLTSTTPNILRWTIRKGNCDAWDEVTITNNQFTVTANNDQTVCDNFATLNGQQLAAGETGEWTQVSGSGSFEDASLYNTQVNNLSGVDPNVFSWTISNGICSASDEVEIYYNYVTANTGALQRHCATTAILEGNDPPPGANGNWVTLIGGPLTSITTPTLWNSGVTDLGEGQNTFQWTVTKTLNSVTCSDVATLDIFNDIPTTANVEPDNEVCSNSTQLSVITIPTIGTGVWTADKSVTFDNTSSFNVNVSDLVRGETTFTWTVSNQACTSTDDVVITNNTVFSTAGPDKSTGCADHTILSGNDPTLTQGTGLWTDQSGSTATIVYDTRYNTSVTGLEQGTTQFQWTVELGNCSISDNVNITNNQITANAGFDQTTCNDYYGPLDGNDVSGNGGTGVWESVGNTADITNVTLFNTGVTNLDPGLNTFKWTVTSGAENCTDFDEVSITNDGVIANAGTDFETCDATINLSAQPPTKGTGLWTQSSGNPVGFVDSTDPATVVNGLTGGVYAFTWTVTEGSCSDASTVVVSNNSPQAANASTGAPNVCFGTASLIGNVLLVGETGIWTKVDAGGTIADPSNNNTSVSNMQLGSNTFRWTISKGTVLTCISSDDVTVINDQVTAVAGDDQDICATSATLSANDPDNTQGTGVWTRIGVNSATIVTPTLFNTVVTNLAENTTHGFTWTVTQGSCSASDDVDVNNLVVLADAGVNQSTCNTSYQLSGNNATANGATGVWTTAGSADITSPTLHNTWVTNLGQGINRFTWTVTSSGGCIEQSSVEITYNLVLANAGIDREICDPSINLGATEPAFGSGVWTQLSGPAVTIVDQTLYNTQITGLVGADYAFTWTVTNNSCSGSADVNIINSSPQIATANVGAAEVCDGIGTLIGNPLLGGETGLWSKVVAGGVITDPTSVNTTVTSLTSGLNTFMWTISKGSTITCTSDATVGITNSEVTASATADNLTSCDGTAFLRGNDAGLQGATGMWSVNTSATINDPTANNTLATNLVALDNTFTWTVSKGACDATANVIISNKQIIANAGSDSPVCTSTASFNADNPAPNQGTWSIINAGATTTIADISLFNSQVTGLQPGANIFRWQVSGDGCIDDDFVTITNDTVIVAAGTTTSVCLFEGDLSANALSSGQTGLWISAGANPVIENSTSPATHVTNLDYGTNTFFWTVTTTAGCNSSVEYQLINNSPTPADAGTYPPLCTSTVSLAANNPLYGTGSWSVVGGSGHIVDPTNRTTNVTGLGTGANVLRWTISHNGCDNWDEAIIENNSFTVNAGIDQPNHCSTTTNLNSPDTLSGAWTRISGGSTILNPSLTNTEVTNLSFGENRFLWTVSQNGCTISDEVIVTTNFTEPAITEADKPVCQADNVSIAANGQTYGTGLWTRTGGTGTIVDATDNNTFVNGLSLGPNTFRWTISYQSCSDYNDLIITNNAVVADAGNDQLNLCVGNTALASIEPASGIGSWSLSSGLGIIANSLDENTTVSGLALGDNIFQWSVVNGGCTTFDEVTIRNNSPTQAATGSDQPICSTTTNLSGNNPTVGTGIWSVFGNQATIHTPTLYNTSVTVDPGSTNNFTWTITNGACSTYASMNVINNSFTVYAGIDQTRCSNDALMDATGPQTGTGTWTGAWSTLSGGGVFSNTAQNNATVSNLGPNTNIFRWTVTRNGCTTFDDVNIINRTVTISADDVMTCNDNAILDGNNPALQGNSGLWKTIAPTTVSIAQPTLFNSTVSNLDPGRNNLRWVVSNALCSDSVNVVANYYIPVANAGADRPFGCENFVQLNANQPPSTGNGEWSIAFGGAGVVIHDNTLYNTQVTNLEIGDNEFIWTVTDQGCINSDQITINNSQPENDDGVDQAGCTNTFTLDAEQPSGSGTGLWTLSVGGASFANETLYNTQVTVDRGTNILTWTITDNGCVASKDFAIVNNLTAPQAGEDVPVCVNQIGLAAADPGVDNGSWSIIGGAITEIFDDSTNPNATVTNLRKGNITFVWTVSNAYCSASDNVVVTNNTPNITAGNNRTICENYVTLAGNNPALEADPSTGIWENVNHTGIIVNPTMYNTQVTDLENGANVYRWTVTNTDCSISEEVTITSNIINVDAGVDRTVCDSIVDLSAVTPTTGVWERMNGNATFDNASVYNTTARNLSAFNTFRWNAQSGTCSNYDEVTIYSSLPEIANTEIDKPVCQSSTTITANSPDYSIGETGLWTIPGGSSATIATPTNRDTYITGLDLGPNTFRWTISSNDSPNCTTWNEITVTNNQVVADAGPDQRRCFTDATMNAGGAGTSTGAWTIVGTSTAIIANNSIHNTAISNLSPGINTFKWTVTGTGCTAEDEVVIHNDIPTVPVAGDDQNVCEDSAPLNANNPDVNRGTGIWDHVGGSGIIDNVSEFNTSVSGLANGRNTFRWTIKLNECSLFDDIDIFNNSVTVNAGVPQIICSDEYQLDGNTPVTGNGSWSIIGGVGIFDNSMLPTTWVRNLAKGQNTLRWTIDDGTCVNYDELTIYNNLPVTPVVEADKPVCSDFATIGVNPAPDYLNRESGLWIRTAGNGTIADRTAVNTSVSGLAPDVNTFLWTVTKTTGGVDCSLSDEINITNNSVTASTGVDKPVCGTTSTLSGNDPGTGIGTWTKLSGTGIIAVSNDYNTTVSNLSTGENIFRWTIVRDLCSDFDDVVITNNQYISSANPGGANVLCEDYSEVIADIPPAGTSGQWIMYAGVGTFDDPTSNTTYVRGLGQGPNTIRWVVSKDGCDTNAEFNITNNSVSTEAGDDQVVCTTTTSLTATPIPSGGSGYWTRLSGTGIIDNSASSATSVSNLSLGSNIFTWHVDANGCSDESSLVVTNNTFTVSAGSNEVYCGSTYPLAGEDPAPGYGLWTIENGTGSFANPSSNGTVVSNLSNGDNTFRWTVTRNGCTFYDDVTITNDLYTADAGESFPVCGDQTTVTASALNPVWGATGLWTLENGGGTFANPTSASTIISGLASGNNRLRWTVTKGSCIDYDEIIVTNNLPVISAGTPETTCDDFRTLSATPLSPTGTGLWTGGGLTTTIVDPSSSITLITGLARGTNTFAWTVTDNNCTATSTVTITSNHFDAYAGPDQVVTVNSAVMQAQLPDATATGTWMPISGSGTIGDITNPTEPVTDLGYGENTFRWTVNWSGCTSTDDVNIIYNAITADAGPEYIPTCENIVYMSAIDPFPGTGTWTFVSGTHVPTFSDINNPNMQVSDIEPGGYFTLKWTVMLGGLTDEDQVTVKNNEFSLDAGPEQGVCIDYTQLHAEPAGDGTGSWSVVSGGGIFADNSNNETTVTGLNEGLNLLRWTVVKNNGCQNSDIVEITYNTSPTAAFEMTPTSGCSPIDVVFTNTSFGGSVYYWNFGDKLRTDSSLTTFTKTYEALYDKDSTYSIQLVAESAKGCTDTIVQQVTAYSFPYVGFSASPEFQLFPRSTVYIENLSDPGFVNYSWTFGDGTTQLDPTINEAFDHTYTSWGEFDITLTVSSNNCSGTATQTVTILAPQPATTINPGIRASGCEDLSVDFQAYTIYADTFYWDFGDGGEAHEKNPPYIYDEPGTYIVKLYAGGPGTNYLVNMDNPVRVDTVIVYAEATASFEALPDTVMLPDQPVICHNNSINGETYLWNFGGIGDSLSREKSPVHYYTEPGVYTINLDVWTEHGCHADASQYPIVVEPAGTIVFPNAFNPFSGYQLNKVFKPLHRGIREYKLEIFNRWGEKIFESTDPEIGWDGNIDGKIGAQDVYAWKLTGKYRNGTLFKATGNVTLLR